MKTILLLFVLLFCVGSTVLANTPPVVRNVIASQRTDGSGIVDIWYTLYDADNDKCTISIQVSDDGGTSWTITLSAGTLNGKLTHVTNGRWKISWSSKTDLPGAYGPTYRIRVNADDEQEMPIMMVSIPQGTFQMGDNLDGDTRALPLHQVTLSPFLIGKHPVTNGHYRAFLQSALSNETIYVSDGIVYGALNNLIYCDTSISSLSSQLIYSNNTFIVREKGGRSMVNDPVVRVTWFGAVAYCNWLSQQEGKDAYYNLSTWGYDFGKNGYRLPTEAQWEYAARGGLSGKRFPWGDTISHSQANYYSRSTNSFDISSTRGFHYAWDDGIEPYTSPVGSFAANGYELHDMAGNVSNWCNDWYGNYTSSPKTDPIGPASGAYRVIRGGGWRNYIANYCRVGADRPNHVPPFHRHNDIGFRLALPE